MKQLFPTIAVFLLLTASCTNLHEAVRQGEIKEATDLIDGGASIDRRDDQGMTPLMLAVRTERPAMVDLLLKKGADVAARDDNGRTALWHAFEMENATAFQKILERGGPAGDFLDAHDPGALSPTKRRLYRLAAEKDLVKQIQRQARGADLRFFDTYFSKFPKGHYLDTVERMLGQTIAADYREVENEGSVAALQRFIEQYGQLGQRSFLVTASSLNIRSANSTGASKVGEYEKGDVVYADTVQDDWVQTDRGWVSRTYLKQIQRRMPVAVPYLRKASEKIEAARKPRAGTYRPPARRIAPKVRKAKPPPPAARTEKPVGMDKPAPSKPEPVQALTQPDQSVDARQELETILARPTLAGLEAFILKYKDQTEQQPLVTRARREYRSILLGE